MEIKRKWQGANTIQKNTKNIQNHQNYQKPPKLVEIKGNGKGYLRGTVVDVMETAGKWYGVGAPEALP
jgi:hypothetical protein